MMSMAGASAGAPTLRAAISSHGLCWSQSPRWSVLSTAPKTRTDAESELNANGIHRNPCSRTVSNPATANAWR